MSKIKGSDLSSLDKNIKEMISEENDNNISKDKSVNPKLVESQYVDESFKHTKHGDDDDDYGEEFEKEEDEDKNIAGFFQEKQRKSELIEDFKKSKLNSQIKPKHNTKLTDKQYQQQYYKLQDESKQKKIHIDRLEEQLKKTKTAVAKTEQELSYVKRIGKHGKQEKIDIEQLTEVENLKDENQKLKQKIIAMNNQLKKPEIRKQYKAIGEESKINMTRDQQKVKDLVKLNEMLKKQLRQSEENCRNLQKMMNSKVQIAPNEVHEKNKKLVGVSARLEDLQKQSEYLKRELESQRAKAAELNALNRDQKEEITDLKKENSILSLSVNNAKEIEDDLRQVRKEKDKLEARLRELAVSPIFKDYDDRVNNRQQLSTMQEKLIQEEEQGKSLRKEKEDISRELSSLEQENKELKQKNQNLKVINTEYKAKIDRYDQQMAPFRELQKMDPDLYLKALGEVKYKSDRPDWNKYAQIEETINTYPESEQNEQLTKELQEAIYEKGQLAQQLKKSQTMLQTRMEIEREKDSLHKVEIQKLEYQLQAAQSRVEELSRLADVNRGTAVAKEFQGDGASVFSTDDMTMQGDKDHNYLDLWIGKVDIYPSNLEYASGMKIKQSEARDIKTFCTVDFYDHNTQNTGIKNGTNPEFNCQIAFKVEQNEVFLEYLYEGYMKFEIYAAIGTNAIKLGQAEVSLKKLYEENTSDQTSILVKEKIQLFTTNDRHQDIANIEVRFKLRFSPYQSLQWLNTKKQGNQIEQKAKKQFQDDFEKELSVRERQLALVITKAIGLPSSSQSFVYYSLKGGDFFSQTLPDSNPSWNYHENHKIQYDESFVAFLKQEKLKFIIFDDGQGLHDGENDILGIAELEAKELCKDTIIEAELDIYKGDTGQKNRKKIGKLFVKTFWMDALNNKHDMIEIGDDNNINDVLEKDITYKIATNMKQRRLDLKSGFRIFDRDEDSVINFEDFSETITGTLNMKLHPEELEFYFKRLKQPFNEREFENHFRKLIQNQRLADSINDAALKGEELSRFRSAQFNTPQVQRVKQKIEKIINLQLEQGTSVQALFNDIDASGEGVVDMLEFKGWLLKYGVEEQDSDLQQFLNTIDRNKDKRINLTEFFEFILEDSRPAELESMRRNRGGSSEKYLQNVQKAKQAILDYMATHKMTFREMHTQIDKNNDNLVSISELRQFLINIVSQSVGPNYLNSLVSTFDKNRDGRIDYNEFVNEMQRMVRSIPDKHKRNYYYSLFSGCKTTLTHSTNQRILIGITNYLNQKGVSLQNLFTSIDVDQNNRLNENELKYLLENKLQIILEDEQFNEFFEYLDEDRDLFISISEWAQKLKPQLEEYQQNLRQSTRQNNGRGNQHSKEHLQNLYKKLVSFTLNKGDTLLQQFEYNQTTDGQISAKRFTSILVDNYISLSNDDISSLINSYLIPTDVNCDNVFFRQWLASIDKNILVNSTKTHSQQRKSMQLSREIFSKIKRIATSKNLTQEQIFRKFDQDKSNTINKKELQSALQSMFQLDNNEIEQIFQAIDVEKDGIIKFSEFQAILNLDEM